MIAYGHVCLLPDVDSNQKCRKWPWHDHETDSEQNLSYLWLQRI